MNPREYTYLAHWYLAGAHMEALVQAFGRDRRTIRRALQRAGVSLRAERPLPPDWRTALPVPTIAAVEQALEQLQAQQQTAWQQMQGRGQDGDVPTYAFSTLATYQTLLQSAQPQESLLTLAQRLGLDPTRVLLAYAERLAALPRGL